MAVRRCLPGGNHDGSETPFVDRVRHPLDRIRGAAFAQRIDQQAEVAPCAQHLDHFRCRHPLADPEQLDHLLRERARPILVDQERQRGGWLAFGRLAQHAKCEGALAAAADAGNPHLDAMPGCEALGEVGDIRRVAQIAIFFAFGDRRAAGKLRS